MKHLWRWLGFLLIVLQLSTLIGVDYNASAQTNHRDETRPLLLSLQEDFSPQHSPTEIKSRAFAGSAVLPLQGIQTVYAVVQDENLNPVERAHVTITAQKAGEDITSPLRCYTNAQGFCRVQFPVIDDTPGLVEVFISATYRLLTTQTKTSFQIWW